MHDALLSFLPFVLRSLTDAVAVWGELAFCLILGYFLAVAVGSRFWAADERDALTALASAFEESRPQSSGGISVRRSTIVRQPIAARLRDRRVR